MSKVKRSGLNTTNLERYAESLGAQPATPKPLSPLLPVADLPVSLLDPAPWNARRFFDVKQLQILGADMLENGQIHPITVRQLGERFEVVVGERRMRAAAMVGMTMLRAHVRPLEDREARRIGLAENLQREDLNPYEETLGWLDLLALELDLVPSFQTFVQGDEQPRYAAARVLRRLHKESLRRKGEADHNVMVQELGADHNVMVRGERLVLGTDLESTVNTVFSGAVNMTWASFVKNRLPILALPADLLEVMYRGELEYTKAAELGKVKDEAQRSELLERVLQLQLPLTQVRQLVAEAMNKPKVEPDALGRLATQTVKRLGERLNGLSLERRARAERLLQELRSLLEEA